jgi:heme exporter protein C
MRLTNSRLRLLLAATVIFDLSTLAYSILYGEYPPFLPGGRAPISYKLLYVHVPLSWNMYLAFTISFISSILFLHKSDAKFDALAIRAAIIGLILGFISVASGMVWAEGIWGSQWSWDPRETATVILLVVYLGYASLRYLIDDLERRRVLSAAYGIAAFVTLPISYISATMVKSLHEMLPGQPISEGMRMLLGIRVLSSTLLVITILYLCYNRYNSSRLYP